MKRIIQSAAIGTLALGLLFSASSALADNDVGCGVGTLVWEGQTGLLPKLGASSTNQLAFQSLSITFDVLGCKGRTTVTAQVDHFADENFERLAASMAAGEGDTLVALSDLMQVPADDRGAFFVLTQDNFATLFPSEETTSREMLEELQRLMAEDATLAPYAQG